ncbi:hypothetical protein CUMW_227790, partial [Citrus unshiu]
PLNMLRLMKLSHSENLIKTPDFTKVPNLEELDLEGCTRLREIHQSLLRHNKLILLNLKGCTSLTTLPGEIFMKSLKTLVLSGCLKLRKLPRVVGRLQKSRDSSNYCKQLKMSKNSNALWLLENKECKMLQNLPRLPASIHWISLDGCVSLKTLSDVLNLNEHQLPYLHLPCVDCLKLAGNYDLALSLLKEYIKNSEDYMRYCYIIVPGSEIPEWFEYQNNEGSSITISTPPKTYKNSKLVGYAMCCVFHVPKYSLPYYIQGLPVHELSIDRKPTSSGMCSIYLRKQFGQAMSDHLFLYYQNREDISEVEFSSPSGLELKRCGVHPIYVHQGDKFNQTTDPVWNLNEFGHDCSGSTSFTHSRNDDLDRAEGSGSCRRDDAGSTTSSERSFLKRSLEEYVGAAEASGSGCCNDDEEPQPKRFKQLE